ncbi:MAG: hypothetical protein ACYTAO_10730, partial [Planctomycetota bacterium]
MPDQPRVVSAGGELFGVVVAERLEIPMEYRNASVRVAQMSRLLSDEIFRSAERPHEIPGQRIGKPMRRLLQKLRIRP